MLALARKEWIHILRDWRSLVMALCAPLLLVILFGYALKLDVESVTLIVWDQSETPESRELISRFQASPYFTVQRMQAASYPEIQSALDHRRALAALVIPTKFDKRLQTRQAGNDVQLLVDGSDANTATIAIGYVEALVQQYNHDLVISSSPFQTKKPSSNKTPSLNSHIWYNPNLNSQHTIVPGLIAVIMMVISTLMTSLAVAREWDQGSMAQLISTPMKAGEFIIGKLAPYFALSMIDMFMVVLVGLIFFDVPLKGSVWLVILMSAIFCSGSLFLGLLISSYAKNQLLATQLAMICTFVPSFLLSGFFTPISSMPRAIQLITYFVPARYFITLLRGIFLKGVGLSALWPEALILTTFTIGLALLTVRTLKNQRGSHV
jgi:ABC-2 type transport system permease protein